MEVFELKDAIVSPNEESGALSPASIAYLSPSDSIERVGLSVRSYNSLRRAGIHTVGAMMALDRDKLKSIKKLGAISIAEIEQKQDDINAWERLKLLGTDFIDPIFENHAKITVIFYDATGTPRCDIPLKDLRLSYRANRILKEAGYDFASKLIGITTKQLLALPHMGKGTLYEIMHRVSNLKFDEASINEIVCSQAEKDCMKFISSYVSYIPAQSCDLYESLLPEFRNSHVNNSPIDEDDLFKSPILRKLVTDKILASLDESLFGVSKDDLLLSLQEMRFPTHAVNSILHGLSTDGIISIGNTIEMCRPSLWEFVETISNDNQRQMLTKRLLGKTLGEIGEKHGGITRERVRQITKKCLDRKQVTIKEDKYCKIFETYSFSKEDFRLAFDTDDSVYIYLTIVCEKAGSLPLIKFLEDTDYPVELRKDAERAVYKKHFTIDGTHVLRRRTDLSDYVVRTYCREETSFDDVVDIYNNILEDLGVADDSRFIINRGTFQNRLTEAENVLWKYQSRFRYYDMNGRDFSSLLEGLKFDQYKNLEFSSLKFFQSYPKLMEEYDLRDEYELHNLLRKLYSKLENSDIVFSRMPMIEFGQVDRYNQVLDLLTRLAPISVKDFCEAYEAEYGVLARTVAGTFITCIDNYKDQNGIYDLSAEPLPANQMEIMRELLPDDYYEISSIRKLYCRVFPASNANMINSYTLKSMGFIVLSSYVIKARYASATEFFKHILTAEDVVDTRLFPTTLTSQISYSIELDTLKGSYEIVEFEPLRFINRRRLASLGAAIEDMYDFCDKVAQYVKPKAYFTIHSLRRHGFAHPILDLGFNDWFYASILKEDKERFCYRRMGGIKVFCQSAEYITMETLFIHILEQCGDMKFDEFTNYLVEEYGIKMEKPKIVHVLDSSPLHYDRIAGLVMQHKAASGILSLSDDDILRATHILCTKFKDGFRTSSKIDFERFSSLYAFEYGKSVDFSTSDLDCILILHAIIVDDRAYVYETEVVDSIYNYITQMNSPCIYLKTFFETFYYELIALGVLSTDILKAFIEKYYSTIFYKRDYIYIHPQVSPSTMICGVFDEQAVWSVEDLRTRFPEFKAETIKQVLNHEEYLRVKAGFFTHINTMNLPSSEGEKIIALVNKKLENRYYIILDEIDFTNFAILNPMRHRSLVREAVYIKFLSNSFSKSGQVVTRRGEKHHVKSILEQYCSEAESVSFEELSSFEAEFHPEGRTHPQCLIAANSAMVRVSYDLFVAESKVNFDIQKIDKAIAHYCRGEFIPLWSIVDFSRFPYTGYPWNHHLLESYIRKYSSLFKYDARTLNSASIGVIVSKSFAYKEYDDILAIALAKAPITLGDKKTSGEYLFDNGYIGWKDLGKSEDKILDKARKIRQERAD